MHEVVVPLQPDEKLQLTAAACDVGEFNDVSKGGPATN